MPGFTFRPAHKQDLDGLTNLMYEYIVDFYSRPRPAMEKIHELIHTLLEQKAGIQFVAEQEGKLVGFATLYFTFSTIRADKITIMNDLYVKEEHRGKGVAAELFKTCHSFTKENGYASMIWETARDNLRAQRFYEKMGGIVGEWITYSI